MKTALLALVVLLAGCVSVDLPGVVTDAAKVTKDTYRSMTGKKDGATDDTADLVTNTYIGQDNQSAADVKQRCVDEAAVKLNKANGKEVAYTVVENTITTVNQALAANCKLALAKPPAAAPAGK